MKKKIMAMVVALAAAAVPALAGTPVSTSELPQAVLTFLAKHFPNDPVRKAEKDQGRRGLEYEVDLTSGAEADFRADGTWKKVEAARGKAVPAAIVPAAIADFVKNSFPGTAIKEISRRRGGYEVELDNGTELKLTEDAKPLTEQRRH